MYGFSLVVSQQQVATSLPFKNVFSGDDYRIYNHMINKFEKDKLFYQDDEYIIVLDGFILNKTVLEKASSGSKWSDAIILLYKQKGESFFSSFRGSFAGVLYDIKSDKWIIFGDHLGSKFIYYTLKDDKFICSMMMSNQYTLLKENKIDYKLDTTGAYYLLTFGFMLEDRTICSEIRKIQPGCYIVYEKGKVTEKEYYLIDNTPNSNLSENDAIDIIDFYFRAAVKREYEKDLEYNYKHLCALSGGLDCRMTTFVAHELGYSDQLNITFSQTDYYDQTVPQKIASDLKHEWLFKSLDNGTWLSDVDTITQITGGNVLYSGTAHGNSLFKYMNFDHLGILHSGQIGDIVISSNYSEKTNDRPFDLSDVAYSKRLLNKLDIKPQMNIKNCEMGFMYYRALNGANNGQQNEYNYTESYSPFFDPELLDNVMSIPVRYRQYHNIYKKWILTRYPKAADYIWEHLGTKIQAKTIVIKGRDVALKKMPEIFFKRYLSHTYSISGKDNMNPIAYYIKNNRDLYDVLDSFFYYSEKINDEELRKDIEDIRLKGSPMEIIQAVSLLSAIKLYY